MNKANDPNLQTWIEVPFKSDFPIQNIPFGICSTPEDSTPRVCTRIGDTIIDLHAMTTLSLLNDVELPNRVFQSKSLNNFISLGKEKTRQVRNVLSKIFTDENSPAKAQMRLISLQSNDVTMHLPVQIGDYTDFYSSIEHATNVGTMFRDPNNALLPNWKHLPVGYHGRASSIVVSGTEIHRPIGQSRPGEDGKPKFGPSKLLDFELEMGFVIGKNTNLGQRVSTEQAEEYIFGLALFNDWSARDIQAWEYVPLGPFLAKNFASTMGSWIVTLDALEPFRIAGPVQDPKVLPYLEYKGSSNYDINLEVSITPEHGKPTIVCQSNYKYMYWNMRQQVAHHSITGCNLQVGDLMASGTISGPTPESYGSMLELTWRGANPLTMSDGTQRKFVNDQDTVTLGGYGISKAGIRIGFGKVDGKILPANP